MDDQRSCVCVFSRALSTHGMGDQLYAVNRLYDSVCVCVVCWGLFVSLCLFSFLWLYPPSPPSPWPHPPSPPSPWPHPPSPPSPCSCPSSQHHSDYRCEREVSTILCVHDVECLHDCHEHGECVDGECTCQLPWLGPSCADLDCSVSNCSGHGQCLEGIGQSHT